MAEILHAVANELEDIPLPGGLVLTGGTALMEGLPELAEAIIPLRVQVGYPKALRGLTDRVNHPMYATSIGLVLYGEKQRHQALEHSLQQRHNAFGRMLQRIKEWFGY